MTSNTLTKGALVGAGVCVAVVAVAALLQRGLRSTPSYAAVSPAATAVFMAAGLGLLSAAAVASADRSTGSLGTLSALAAIAWLGQVAVGWDIAPSIVRSTAMLLVVLLAPVLVHTLAAPLGHLPDPFRRFVVAIGYAVSVVVGVTLVLTDDPFFDPYCWPYCTDNVLLLVNSPGIARLSEAVLRWTVVVIGVVSLLAAGNKFFTSSAVARRVSWVTAVPAAAAVGAEIAYAWSLLVDPAENPEQNPFRQIFFIRATALLALASGIVLLVIRNRRRHAAVAALINDLNAISDIGSLQTSLSLSVGDSSLTVAYWLPHAERFVDPVGRPVHPDVGTDRHRTIIVRDGGSIAVISHDRTVLDDRALGERIGSAALLALDNERLAVESLSYLNELRDSQSRIIEASNETRRRIERDLHDGAQQRLLAVLYELLLAKQSSVDDQQALALDNLIGSVRQALGELRILAQGIFPAILEESGLEAALWGLVDQAPRPIEIARIPAERLPPALERTVYLVVLETISDSDNDEPITISIERRENTIVVRLSAPEMVPSQHVEDRVGAAGGTVFREIDEFRAEIPCE